MDIKDGHPGSLKWGLSIGWLYIFSLYLCVVCMLYVNTQFGSWVAWKHIFMKQCDFHELWQFIPYAIGLCYIFCLSTTISNIAASVCMIVWNSIMFLFCFGPLIPGTKIRNVVKVVKESGRDAKFRKHEHYLSGILLLSPSYILLFL